VRLKLLAEEAGFEPALGYSPKHAFQACDLNHSSTLPKTRRIIKHIASKILINHCKTKKALIKTLFYNSDNSPIFLRDFVAEVIAD
jgi:hypothetical protein